MKNVNFVDVLKYYLTHNFALVVMAIGFLILFLNRNSRLRRHSMLLLIDMMLVLVLSVATTIEYCFESLSVTYPIQYVGVILGYTIRPFIIYFVILTYRKPDIKTDIILGIPIILNCLLVSLSPATHWLFYYGENNAFIRVLPWGYIPHTVAAFYLGYLAVLMIMLFRQNDKTQAIAAAFILFANGIATTMETLDVVEDILSTTAAASILFFFVSMFVYYRKRDSLTGLLDRHTFYVDYSTHKNRVTALIGFDLNGLKNINDTLGHAAGDIALKTVSRILLAHTTRRIEFYRLGGDEFEAICLDMSKEEIEETIRDLDEAILKSGYVCSIGYSLHSKDDTVDKILHRADDAMYSQKREYYESHERIN